MDETTTETTTETAPATTADTASIVDALLAMDTASLTELAGSGLILLVAVLVAYLVASRIAVPAVTKFAKESEIQWDDILVEMRVFSHLIPVAPLVVLQWGVRWVPGLPEVIADLVATIALCLIIIFLARTISALLSAVNEIYRRYSANAERPIKGYIQVIQVATYIVAGLLVVSLLMGRSPLFVLSGFGAMTAVLLLVFRDSLLSFVAGIQLTQNDLIRVGDWIEMPQFNADGDVTEVALNVVTVQNWDRTITVIPTHKFLEHSFRNWRGMAEAGGRRIARNINLDMSTIGFLTEEQIENLRTIKVLREYIDTKCKEIDEHNESIPGEMAGHVANQRKMTNVGTFRAYISAYLRQHPGVSQDMTFLVRQLAPTPEGLPMQVYVFSNDIRWAHYEAIQSDIFDHLLSIVSEFGLRIFQNPTGADFGQLSQTIDISPDDSDRAKSTREKSSPAPSTV